MFYLNFFICALSLCIILNCINFKKNEHQSLQFSKFQIQYLIVYSLAYFSDWIKGPYVYILYESYGLSESEIAYLFIIGFGSSAISGPFVGSLADMFGPKKLCLAYFIIYIASALTKHIQDFNWLLIGRILGGIGTSLLTTTFESWMVTEHKRRSFDIGLLDDTFVKSSICNSFSAILAGLLAQLVSNMYGYVAPFVFAILPLTLGFILCWKWWSNIQVISTEKKQHGFYESLNAINKNLWILGFTQSIFLGTMYTFVFLWTPALEGKDTPFGLIFSIFMVMISIGSSVSKKIKIEKENLPYVILGISSFCFFCMAYYIEQKHILFSAFILFECICGLMFPTYGYLRANYIPNEHRTTIMNIYRVPLNVFVMIILLNKKNMSLQTTFYICLVFNIVSFALWRKFEKPPKEYELVDQEEDFGEIEEDSDNIEGNNIDIVS